MANRLSEAMTDDNILNDVISKILELPSCAMLK